MKDARREPGAEAWEAEADRAAASGDQATAQRLLRQVTAAAPDRVEAWLKLAAMCRAQGETRAALEAVSGALRIQPLAFLPLLLKANLLEAAGRIEEAGEAYGHALAQRPDAIPPHLQAPLERAERIHAAHRERMTAALSDAANRVADRLSEAERRRLSRFATNIARKTRPYHCEPSHFHYPGLPEREFHDREDFPWLAAFEATTPAIRAEFEGLMASERAELVPYIQYADDQPLRQWETLNWNRDWTAVHLILNGAAVETNAVRCPETIALLDRIGQPRIAGRSPNAMFSLLAPNTRIPPHSGVANTRLVCHLPLIVPPQCWFRVGEERREWEAGKAWIFDDTIEHEAANDGDRLRVVLIFDIWHPGLTSGERDAVAAIMAASRGDAEGGL